MAPVQSTQRRRTGLRDTSERKREMLLLQNTITSEVKHMPAVEKYFSLTPESCCRRYIGDRAITAGAQRANKLISVDFMPKLF
ncbi:hypothetical protein QQF64_006384 [Cirrhinus molitorella]|uniref:Uncharacterized protein n=1 Tax=Cirrhinus molitorella TaxID=172907 RepID=A0ABR3MEY5_9TELE